MVWAEDYRSKLMTAEQALRPVGKGGRVFIGSACGEPQHLVRVLTTVGERTADTEIIHILTLGVAPYTEERFDDKFRLKSFFVGNSVRRPVAEGRADYVPLFLSQVPAMFASGQVPIDLALIQVTPPDAHGFCSLGVSVDIVKAAAENARRVVAQVNPWMPRVLGDSFIHVSRLDAIVEYEEPLLEISLPPVDEVARRIGQYVAELIEDGSTLQLGIGTLPNAVLYALEDKKNLGIHTEMCSDGVVNLVEKGVITNAQKTLHRGKIVASFCMGSRRLYDFVDNNPGVEFHPSDYTNDPFIISRNEKMVAINGALEVDLTGQVCADSLGYYLYSGIGGHADFIRGAARSRGGKPIIALPSTTPDGRISRIVPHISEGAGVVTTRGDVHYVVTEYGVADLFGKTIRERALALIDIAHPRFRQQLLDAAKAHKYVYPDQVLPGGGKALAPGELEKRIVLADGTPVLLRPPRLSDERGIQEVFYSLEDRDVYFRFHTQREALPHRDAQYLVEVDYERMRAIVALVESAGVKKLVGLGRYIIDPATQMAEVDLVVHRQWQGRGLGTALFGYLVEIAQTHGLKGFTAYVLPGNWRMLHIIYESGYPVQGSVSEGLTVRWAGDAD